MLTLHEIVAPLPPMPIPSAGLQPEAKPEPNPAATPTHRSAWAAGLSRLWSAVSFGSLRSAPVAPEPDLRGTQQ